MDTFQGCFKDGTNGSRDCRYFASIYLITRVATHLGFMLTDVLNNTSILVALLLTVVVLLSFFHPYKKCTYNRMDILFLLVIIITLASAWELKQYKSDFTLIFDRVSFIVVVIPLVYPLCLVLKYCLEKIRTCTEQFKMYRRHATCSYERSFSSAELRNEQRLKDKTLPHWPNCHPIMFSCTVSVL